MHNRNKSLIYISSKARHAFALDFSTKIVELMAPVQYRKLMMHHSLALLPLVAMISLAGCSEKPAEEASDFLPAISASSVAGVAFSYSYFFKVPNDAISRLQEQHAAACEGLGATRCRITGMRYIVSDDGSVFASLALKVDRDAARHFARDGSALVEKSGGKLTNAEIDGEDLLPEMEDVGRGKEQAATRLEDLNKQLASNTLGDRERTALQDQIANLKDAEQQSNTRGQQAKQKLAQSPVQFSYNGVSASELNDNHFAKAGARALSSANAVMLAVLFVLAYGLPWLLLALALVALWRTSVVRKVRNYVQPKVDSNES